MVAASCAAASSGTLRLPAFVPMFPSVPAITGSIPPAPRLHSLPQLWQPKWPAAFQVWTVLSFTFIRQGFCCLSQTCPHACKTRNHNYLQSIHGLSGPVISQSLFRGTWTTNLSGGQVVGFKQAQSVGNQEHFNMDRGFHNLLNGDVLSLPLSMARRDKIYTSDYPNCSSITRASLGGVRPCLSKGCLQQLAPQIGPGWTWTCTIFICGPHPLWPLSLRQPLPLLWSLLAGVMVPSHIASPGTMVDAGGLSGNAATVMFVVHGTGTAAGLAVPFSSPGVLAPATWICHRPRAIVSMTTFQKPHFQFSMLLLMSLLWVLWHVAGELLAIAITSSENVTSRFCNNFNCKVSTLAKCVLTILELSLNQRFWDNSHLTPVSIWLWYSGESNLF